MTTKNNLQLHLAWLLKERPFTPPVRINGHTNQSVIDLLPPVNIELPPPSLNRPVQASHPATIDTVSERPQLAQESRRERNLAGPTPEPVQEHHPDQAVSNNANQPIDMARLRFDPDSVKRMKLASRAGNDITADDATTGATASTPVARTPLVQSRVSSNSTECLTTNPYDRYTNA